MSQPIYENPTPFNSMEFLLAFGEMRGQVRDLVRAMNDKSSRDEDFVRAIAELQALPDDIHSIKQTLSDVNARLTTIETSNATRDGERNMWAHVLKSPSLGWAFAAASLIWAFISGALK